MSDPLDADIDAMLGHVVRGEPVPELATRPIWRGPRFDGRTGKEVAAPRRGRRGALVEHVEPVVPEAAEPAPRVDPKSLPVRFTRLKTMALSPAHYEHACQKDLDDSLCLRLGAGSHAMLFDQPVVCYPHVRNGKRWEAFEQEHADKVILSRAEWLRAERLVNAVRRNKHAMRVLFDGTTLEQRIDWQRAGRACMSTPDALSKAWITDLKSTKCAEPEWFAREVLRRYYQAQLAFYADAAEHKLGVRPAEAYIVAVESTEPHPVTVFHLTPELLEFGTKISVGWFEQLMVCEASDCWPEYATNVVRLDVPPERDVIDQVELIGL